MEVEGLLVSAGQRQRNSIGLPVSIAHTHGYIGSLVHYFQSPGGILLSAFLSHTLKNTFNGIL